MTAPLDRSFDDDAIGQEDEDEEEEEDSSQSLVGVLSAIEKVSSLSSKVI